MLPSVDTLLLLNKAALLCVDLGAKLALVALANGVHDQLHTASLAGAILLGAVLAEVAPLVIAAIQLVLLVEAHDSLICGSTLDQPGS